MPTALICSTADVEAELGKTLLWRSGMRRHLARRLEEARNLLASARPGIVVVDRDFPGSQQVVSTVRQDAATRQTSVVVMARGDFETAEIDLLEAGANAVLRLPVGPDWDERLTRLVEVPARREARFSVFFQVEGGGDDQGAPVVGTALNLSVSGMLLETPSTVHIGSEVQLQFRLPDLDDLVRATGRVVRHAGARRFGIEFLELSAAGIEGVRRFVAQGPANTPAAGW
jgi:CheY-like chemotaxis protein